MSKAAGQVTVNNEPTPSGVKTKRIQALQRQIQQLQQRLAQLDRLSNRYSWLRVLSFLAGIAASGGVLFLASLWLFWTVVAFFGLLFGIVVYRHRQLERTIARFTIWQTLKQEQIARAQLDWPRMPAALPVEPDSDHPFAGDLDLGGEYSLHRLLDGAVTLAASQRLYTWLTTPVPAAETIAQRQQLVRELLPLRLFRHKLTLNARFSAKQATRWDTQALLAWFQAGETQSALGRWLLLFVVLAVANIVLWSLNQFGWIGRLWLFTFIPYMGLQLLKARETSDVFADATAIQASVEQLVAVLHQLETFSYHQTPHLRTLCAPLLDPARRPSRYLRRIQWVVAATGIQGNPFLALLLNAIVPWNFYFAYLLQQYKRAAAEQAQTWLDVWCTLEALSSLANFADLNPEYTFPIIQPRASCSVGARSPETEKQIEEAGSPQLIFSVRQLGHPLLPDEQKVCNDFTVPSLGEVAIITGSNMAGKSTFLRALGMNLALAYAGSVVNAQRLETDLFRLFTCIKISDSVTKGVSYFYAEVKRLKALLTELERTDALPLFFCIDEIFRGTNNRERLIGSRAYIQSLVGKHGAGLISTHDLELVKLADEMAAITNYHFRDDLVNGAMTFDYRLHPGPCPTTNALKVMRNAGLPVPVDEVKREV